MQGASGGSKEAEYSKAAAQAVASRLWEKQSIDISVLKKELKNRRSSFLFFSFLPSFLPSMLYRGGASTLAVTEVQDRHKRLLP